MTSVHNAVLAAGASSADLTVLPLEPHGLNSQIICTVYAKNGAILHEITNTLTNRALIFYPTTDTIVVTNHDTRPGNVQINAK